MNIEGYGCEQLCVVVAEGWDTHKAKMYCFEKKDSSWNFVFSSPVVIGKKGMAWGIGLHAPATPEKREGDMKTPAGIFTFGSVFGKEASPSILKPYIETHSALEAIDDPHSRYYNQIVDALNVIKDWTSSESMVHELYKWGIVVEHNACPAAAHKGSCIFFHLWRSEGEGTAGCTAMQEVNLKELINWLDPEKRPLLIQLPKEEYVTNAPAWGFPPLSY